MTASLDRMEEPLSADDQGKPASAKILPELDGIRALSIVFVLAAHLLPLGPSYWGLNAVVGDMGMSLFFCLSGFLITRFLWDTSNPVEFFKRRFARIVPLLYLYGFIVAVLVSGRLDSFAAIAGFYLNYADAAIIPPIAHLWSLCVEMHFYLVIGITIGLFGRKGFWLLPIIAGIVLGFRMSEGALVSIRTHLRVDEILTGGMLALLWINASVGIRSTLERMAVPVALVTLPIWILSSMPAGGLLNYGRGYFAATLVGCCLFMQLAWVKRLLGHPAPRYIARISYALYIWHPLFALGWFSEGNKIFLYAVKRPISFALTFAAAHLTTFTLEAYFQRLVRPKASQRRL